MEPPSRRRTATAGPPRPSLSGTARRRPRSPGRRAALARRHAAVGRLRGVTRVEEPSFSQLSADGGEISGRGYANLCTRFFALLEGGLAHDLKNAPVVAADHRRHIDPAHGGHAGQGLDALY